MVNVLTRSILPRLGQGARVNATRQLGTRQVPPLLPSDTLRPASSTVHLYGLPSMRTRRTSDSAIGEDHRVVRKAQEQTAKEIYDTASNHAPVAQVLLPRNGKNFAWIEFNQVSDAASFLKKFDDNSPLVIGNRPVRPSFGERSPALGEPVDSPELAIRYNTTNITSEEALKLAAERYPEATVTTNVKSSRGIWGTLFLRFPETATAHEAFSKYRQKPILLGESVGQMVNHPEPITDMCLYNLMPFAPIQEILDPLKKFGEITKSRFPFEAFGPKVTGYLHIAFSQVSQAQSLIEATMEEQLVLHGRPVRAEYHLMKFNPRPKTEWVNAENASGTGSTAAA